MVTKKSVQLVQFFCFVKKLLMGRPSKRKLQSRAAAKESIKYNKTNSINIALYHELEEAEKYFEIDEDPDTTSQFGQSIEIEEDIEQLLNDLNFSHEKTNFQSSQWRGFYSGLSERTRRRKAAALNKAAKAPGQLTLNNWLKTGKLSGETVEEEKLATTVCGFQIERIGVVMESLEPLIETTRNVRVAAKDTISKFDFMRFKAVANYFYLVLSGQRKISASKAVAVSLLKGKDYESRLIRY
jgi:hypothetical protein